MIVWIIKQFKYEKKSEIFEFMLAWHQPILSNRPQVVKSLWPARQRIDRACFVGSASIASTPCKMGQVQGIDYFNPSQVLSCSESMTKMTKKEKKIRETDYRISCNKSDKTCDIPTSFFVFNSLSLISRQVTVTSFFKGIDRTCFAGVRIDLFNPCEGSGPSPRSNGFVRNH